MTRTSAYEQLKEMGIPAGRARAALRRAKGDAMAAAERVFAGEFDYIPSEDEGNSEDELEGPPDGATHHTSPPAGEDFGEESVPFEDDILSDQEQELEDHPQAISADPYAGVFFSKDRVEKIIEQDSSAAEYVDGARIVTVGEWMSGCPEGNEQSHLFQLHNLLTERNIPCPISSCNAVVSGKSTPFLLPGDFSAYISMLRAKRLTCTTCKTTMCWACHERTSPKQQRSSSAAGSTDDDLFHCANMQGVIVGIGMIMIDQYFETLSPMVQPSVDGSPPTKRKARGGENPESKKTATARNGRREGAKGTGYAGSHREDVSGQTRAAAAQAKKDDEVVALLKQVQVFLPQTSRSGQLYSSDHMVHPTTLAHLRRRSGFINHLLRNDSLLDMSNRGELYRTLFDWLEVVSAHEALASMMAMPQMRPVQKIPLAEESGQIEVTYEGAPSPRELLESIVIQAHAALKGLKAGEPIETEEVKTGETGGTADETASPSVQNATARDPAAVKDSEVLKAFCERIISSTAKIDKSLIEVKGRAFVERMKAELPKLSSAESKTPGTPSEIDGLSDEATVKKYEQWAAKVRFEYCDMTIAGSEPMAYAHAWSEQIVQISLQDLPRRSLTIAKELAMLTTNLPTSWHSSIFLRVDEARVDCIKAMIIGPEGTPYQNGCFLFDIFLPQQYNHQCPSVKSMTTNGGQFRYNPNLYACGKVCLSLLGTWNGPGWISGQSTLLQVLISIQSLILCEEPYLNEPAWANSSGTEESKAYSADVRRMCLIDAMANNLRQPPRPFEDEIRMHFRLKSRAIRKQIDEWKALDNGVMTGRYTKHARSFDNAATALKTLLDELDGRPSASTASHTPESIAA